MTMACDYGRGKCGVCLTKVNGLIWGVSKICDGLWLATESLERRETNFDLFKESAEAIVAKGLS